MEKDIIMPFISDPDIEGHPEAASWRWLSTSATACITLRRAMAARAVTGCLVRPTRLVYWVTWGETRQEFAHFGFELTSARPL